MAAAQTETTAAKDYSGVEDIVVNVRYKEERLQDSPVAITAFPETQLEKLGAVELRDVAPSTPNLYLVPVVTFPNSAAITIRGIGIQGIESTEEPSVGVSVDGVFIARPIATMIDLFDVESIEVLRGPQGMTFGKNSLAGGLNVRTKRPDGEFGWHGEITAGNHERIDFRGAVEFPIATDKLSARVSVMSQNYGGHYTNRVNDQKLSGEGLLAARATVLWTPSDSFDFTLIGFYLRERSDAPGGDNDPDCPGVDGSFQILCFLGYSGEPDDDPYLVGRDAPDDHDTDQWSLIGEMNWDAGNVIVTSITGYIDTDDLIVSDYDQTEVFFFPTVREQVHYQFSEELRIATDPSDMTGFMENLDLVAGMYYLKQKHELVQTFPTLGNSADYATQDHKQFSAFGQAIWHATDKLNFNFGLRYNHETKDFARNSGSVLADPLVVGGKFLPENRPSIMFMRDLMPGLLAQEDLDGVFEDDISRSRTTFKGGVDYRFNDSVMAYFQYSQGYKSGSFGARAGSIETAGPTDDETSESFELGFKTDWFDKRLRLNITAFHATYEGLAFNVFIPAPDNPTGQETLAQNVGEAETKGIEIELTAVPIEPLTLHFSLGLLDTQYNELCVDVDGPSEFSSTPTSACGTVAQLPNGTWLVEEDFTHVALGRAPKVELFFSAEYEIPLGNTGYLTLRGSVWHQGDHYTAGTIFAGDNDEKTFQKAHTLLDASIKWESADEQWSVKLWGKNLTNETYLRGLTRTANFFNQRFWGDPRTWGVTLAWKG
jgi:iron complex outermembrane recepter protein